MTVLKRLTLFSLVLSLASGQVFSLPVTAWVPAYSIPACKTMLQKDFGGVGMKDGLTYLPLQFYLCSGPQLVKSSNTADADITWFINWGKQYNIKVLLCMFNYIGGDWNWPESMRSIRDNRDAFVKAIVAEVDRLGFDGVDIDFEPNTASVPAADSTAYYIFVDSLITKLHAKGKLLTAAVFAGSWGAPNPKWYTTLLKKLDGVGSMGYDWSGLAVDYAQQVRNASAAPQKFMIGMPGWLNTWQGNTVNEQIDWVVKNGTVGLCIWDATLRGTDWQTATVWNKIKAIRQKGAVSVAENPIGPVNHDVLHPFFASETGGTMYDLRGKRIMSFVCGQQNLAALNTGKCANGMYVFQSSGNRIRLVSGISLSQ